MLPSRRQEALAARISPRRSPQPAARSQVDPQAQVGRHGLGQSVDLLRGGQVELAEGFGWQGDACHGVVGDDLLQSGLLEDHVQQVARDLEPSIGEPRVDEVLELVQHVGGCGRCG